MPMIEFPSSSPLEGPPHRPLVHAEPPRQSTLEMAMGDHPLAMDPEDHACCEVITLSDHAWQVAIFHKQLLGTDQALS